MAHKPYSMTISRLTVDKLGMKLYDRVSAVIAEVVANSYDADATAVTHAGEREVKLARRKTLFKYRLHHDQELSTERTGTSRSTTRCRSPHAQAVSRRCILRAIRESSDIA